MAANKKTSRKNGTPKAANTNGAADKDDSPEALEARHREKQGCRLKRKAPREGMVAKSLTDDQIQQRGQELAHAEQELEEWRAKKAAQMREWRDEEEGYRDNISRLADEVQAGQEWDDPQGSIPGIDRDTAQAGA